VASNDHTTHDNVRAIETAKGAGLAVRPTVLDRTTGELIDLAEVSTDRLGAFLASTRELEAELRAAKAEVSREVHRRMDAEARWTVRAGPYKLSGQSPDRSEYDGEELARALRRLVRRGLITREAAANACERVVSHRPRKQGIAALLKLGGEVAEAIRPCERAVESERRVSVSVRREAA